MLDGGLFPLCCEGQKGRDRGEREGEKEGEKERGLRGMREGFRSRG